jgi:hypothetical protein
MAAKKKTGASILGSAALTESEGGAAAPLAAAKKGRGKAGSKEETIELPKLAIKRMAITIIGTSPLIVHAWSEKAKRQMRDKQQGKAKLARGAKDPNEDFESSKYKDSKGRDCIPVFALKKAIVSAATFGNEKKTHFRGSLFIEPVTRGKDGTDLLPIKFSKCVMREDMCRVGGMTKTADMRYRAEYHDWSARVTFEYNESMISVAQILNLIRIAGFSVGICEWRPEKDGHFGRFTIDDSALNAAE